MVDDAQNMKQTQLKKINLFQQKISIKKTKEEEPFYERLRKQDLEFQ